MNKIVQSLLLTLPTTQLLQLTGQRLLLPFYHIITDKMPPHIRHLYLHREVQQFERDLDFFCQYFQPISLHELIAHIKEDKLLPPYAFHLTFDDGLREFYHIIAPILRKRNIPATVFLNSDFVDNKALFFRYKASLIIDFLRRSRLTAGIIIDIERLLREKAGIIMGESVQEGLLKVSYYNQGILDDIANIIGLNFDDFLRYSQPYLTTNQIKELITQGFTFGGHSIDHPEYRFIPLKEQIRQTMSSVQAVQKHFGLLYKTFSFPFTDHDVSKHFFDMIHHKLDPMLDVTFGCAGLKNEKYKTHFQRIGMEGSRKDAKTIIDMACIKYILKTPLLKNKIVRK